MIRLWAQHPMLPIRFNRYHSTHELTSVAMFSPMIEQTVSRDCLAKHGMLKLVHHDVAIGRYICTAASREARCRLVTSGWFFFIHLPDGFLAALK